MINEDNNKKIIKIKEILSQFTDIEMNDIKMESDLICDLGLTSFDLVCLVSSFEEEFNIKRDNMALKSLKTVNDVCKIILK